MKRLIAQVIAGKNIELVKLCLRGAKLRKGVLFLSNKILIYKGIKTEYKAYIRYNSSHVPAHLTWREIFDIHKHRKPT